MPTAPVAAAPYMSRRYDATNDPAVMTARSQKASPVMGSACAAGERYSRVLTSVNAARDTQRAPHLIGRDDTPELAHEDDERAAQPESEVEQELDDPLEDDAEHVLVPPRRVEAHEQKVPHRLALRELFAARERAPEQIARLLHAVHRHHPDFRLDV